MIKHSVMKRILVGCAAALALGNATAWAACDAQRNPIPASRYEMNGAEVLDKENRPDVAALQRRTDLARRAGLHGNGAGFDWRGAKKHARGGWRLPTREELATLISKACTPSINPDAFPNLDPLKLWYWSASETDRGLAWLVQFGGERPSMGIKPHRMLCGWCAEGSNGVLTAWGPA